MNTDTTRDQNETKPNDNDMDTDTNIIETEPGDKQINEGTYTDPTDENINNGNTEDKNPVEKGAEDIVDDADDVMNDTIKGDKDKK